MRQPSRSLIAIVCSTLLACTPHMRAGGAANLPDSVRADVATLMRASGSCVTTLQRLHVVEASLERDLRIRHHILLHEEVLHP